MDGSGNLDVDLVLGFLNLSNGCSFQDSDDSNDLGLIFGSGIINSSVHLDSDLDNHVSNIDSHVSSVMGNSLSGRYTDDSDLVFNICVVVSSDAHQFDSGIPFNLKDENVDVLPDFSRLSSSVMKSSCHVDLDDSSGFNGDSCSNHNMELSNLLVVEYDQHSSVFSES